MNRMTRALIIASASPLGLLSIAIAPAAEPTTHVHEHSGAAAPAPAPTSAAAMQRMQQMHDKWMAATTPAERKALMAEHMLAMQDGMAAMRHMDSGAAHGGMPPDGMQQHMSMMSMMMQMMMDREQMHGDMVPGSPGTAPEHAQPTAPPVSPTKP